MKESMQKKSEKKIYFDQVPVTKEGKCSIAQIKHSQYQVLKKNNWNSLHQRFPSRVICCFHSKTCYKPRRHAEEPRRPICYVQSFDMKADANDENRKRYLVTQTAANNQRGRQFGQGASRPLRDDRPSSSTRSTGWK